MCDWLVLVPHQPRQRGEELVRRDDDFAMVRPELLSDETRVLELVSLALGERDREGLNRLRDEVAHHGHQRRRVDPARQKRAEWYVSHQSGAHRFTKALRVLLDVVGFRTPRIVWLERDVPVLLD